MPQNDITFNRTQGGLDRPLLGEDHLSSLIFYTDGDLPSGFTSSDRIKKIFSLAEAESLGILDDHADETKGTQDDSPIQNLQQPRSRPARHGLLHSHSAKQHQIFPK